MEIVEYIEESTSHMESFSYIRRLRDGREVFHVIGMDHSFFIILDPSTGFHISYTEESILSHIYMNGNPMRVPNIMKIKMMEQQMLNTKTKYMDIYECGKLKIGHLHTNYVKEEGSNEIQSAEYLLKMNDHISILMYYKGYGYSIIKKSLQNLIW